MAVGDEVLGGLVYLEVEATEVAVGDLGTVDLDTFIDALEMRRGIEAGAIAGGGEDAAEGCGRRSFAVGAGNEDAGKGVLRIAECGGECAHVGEHEFAPRRAYGRRGEFMTERVQTVERGLVGHEDIVARCSSRERLGLR